MILLFAIEASQPNGAMFRMALDATCILWLRGSALSRGCSDREGRHGDMAAFLLSGSVRRIDRVGKRVAALRCTLGHVSALRRHPELDQDAA